MKKKKVKPRRQKPTLVVKTSGYKYTFSSNTGIVIPCVFGA